MNDLEIQRILTRRKLLQLGARGLGALGAASLLNPGLTASAAPPPPSGGLEGTLGGPHFKPTAKRVIYLFFSGGPSHIDMYDYHLEMRTSTGSSCPIQYAMVSA